MLAFDLCRIIFHDAVEGIEARAVLRFVQHVAVVSQIVQTRPLVHAEWIGQPEGSVVGYAWIAGEYVHLRSRSGDKQLVEEGRRERMNLGERKAPVGLDLTLRVARNLG